MSKNDGGPAFPFTPADFQEHNQDFYASRGMSLRDWLAGQAMAAIIASPVVAGREPHDFALPHHMNGAAHWAYQQADAMLEARNA